MYIVMEYCPGGELFNMISKKAKNEGAFNESEAADMMGRLLRAVNHCHSLGIAHRDIKPENILVNETGDLKLIDFGLSKQVKVKKMHTIVGTPYYVAPEVLEGKYGLKCDIWSLGVILYILLSGYLPFGGTSVADVFDKIKEAKYSFKQKEWKKVSPEAIELIKNMLEVNTKKRFNAEQCLKHSWFKVAKNMKEDEELDPLDPDILENLTNFKGSSRFKKAAMNLFVKTSNAKEFDQLRKEFEKLDEDHTGQVDAEELSKALKKSDINFPEDRIEAIINEIDHKGNNSINYTEFLAATMTARKLLNENRLVMLFREFDTDDSGYITKENLEEAFHKLDSPLTKKQIQEIITEHDDSRDGKISFEEFSKMLLGEDDKLIELKKSAIM